MKSSYKASGLRNYMKEITVEYLKQSGSGRKLNKMLRGFQVCLEVKQNVLLGINNIVA